jgi:hypothetical protein
MIARLKPTFLAVVSLAGLLQTVAPAGANAREATSEFGAVACEGAYPGHLQGVCTDEREAIYWSWTDVLVKTDRQGRVLQRVQVASHHGDLCFHDGKIHVAVNLGKFNEPEGQADSWIYVYNAGNLAELARHPVPELVHGAGGIGYHEGKFIVVGGLPEGIGENYLYEYDLTLKFQRRHVLASGHTDKGIQTATFADGSWWFGCYGKPKLLLRADAAFHLTGKWEFDASLGIIGLADGRFLVGQNSRTKGVGHQGQVVIARPDAEKGLIVE